MTTPQRVLERLAEGPCSGQALADTLGVSRTAVWKAIELLRGEGIGIEAAAGRGYALVDPAGFGTHTLSWRCGRPVHFHTRCTSTNRLAHDLGLAACPGGTLVVAEEQTGGRGRKGRSWESAAGANLTFSLVLRPALPPREAPLLCLAAAVAVAEVLGLRLKWPNDVLDHEGRKVAGILAEVHAEVDWLHFIVLGVGLNVNQERFGEALPQAASVSWTHGPQDRAGLLGRLVPAIERRCGQVAARRDRVLDAWRELSWTLGQPVRVPESGLEGVAVSLRDDGALMVETTTGVVPVLAGDVELIGSAARW